MMMNAGRSPGLSAAFVLTSIPSEFSVTGMKYFVGNSGFIPPPLSHLTSRD